MTLALDGDTAWVACKEESRIESLSGEELALDGQAIAVLSAFDAVWALDDRGSLYRVGSGKVADLELSKPYNLWTGAGAVWAIDDGVRRGHPRRPGDQRGRPRPPSATARRTWSSTTTPPG